MQFPTVVETLGLGETVTLVLTCPPYLIAGAVTILLSWSSGRFNERTWHITVSKSVAIVGFVAAAATLNMAGRYVAMVIFTIGTYGVNSLILGWCGSVCGRTFGYFQLPRHTLPPLPNLALSSPSSSFLFGTASRISIY
jgi:hypothetical protein